MLSDHLPLLPDLAGNMPLNWPHTGGAHFAAGAERSEGLARLMLGATFVGDDCRVPGLFRHLRVALAAGVDSSADEYWGELGDFDQKIVEAASIAISVVQCRGQIFDPLDFNTKSRLLDWLSGVQGIDMSPNNWRFFRVIIQTALEILGREPDRDLFEADVSLLHELYLGDGWYADGAGNACDYYNPYAFHFYGLVYARWRNDEHAQLFIERAREFARGYCNWFGDDGAPIVYGRSLCYRFACTAFWGALAWFNVDNRRAGQQWRQTMRWWAKQPICNADGQLSIGYAYPNLLASEFYSSQVSPLWAMKGFSPLDLAEQDPFWSSSAEHAAVADLSMVPAARHILYRHGGNAFLLPGGRRPPEMRYFADKYMKFAYSSSHGMSVESTQWIDEGFLGDNVLAIADESSGWRQRSKIEHAEFSKGRLITQWSPIRGCRVTTHQHWDGEYEHRAHTIVCEQPIRFLASGFAVDCWTSAGPIMAGGDRNHAVAEGNGQTSLIAINGSPVSAGVAPCAPNSNLMFPRASVPYLAGDLSRGHHVLDTRIATGGTNGNSQ